MHLQIKFVGAQANEQTPAIALYAFNIRGQAQKVATLEGDKLHLNTDKAKLGSLIALGPDVADPNTLDPKSLVTYKTASQLAVWEKNPIQEIPPQFWRPWLPIHICLAGTVSKCFIFIEDKIAALRSIALGNSIIRNPIEQCTPICNGVVEVWENTCCCFPFLLEDVPVLISKIQKVLAENPVRFPSPPPEGPYSAAGRAAQVSVDRAIAHGQADMRFVPNTQLHQDLQTLQASSASDAVAYFQAHPSLWWIWCHCSTTKLAETPLNANG